MSGETECQRCSECVGRTHHWIVEMFDHEDPDFEPGEYVCKHCGQRGEECNVCDGDNEIERDEPLCFRCGGEAVIPISDEDYDRIMQEVLRSQGHIDG